jgi:hypothetical protein
MFKVGLEEEEPLVPPLLLSLALFLPTGILPHPKARLAMARLVRMACVACFM